MVYVPYVSRGQALLHDAQYSEEGCNTFLLSGKHSFQAHCQQHTGEHAVQAQTVQAQTVQAQMSISAPATARIYAASYVGFIALACV